MKVMQRIREEEDFELMRSYADGERELIAKCFKRAWETRNNELY